MSGKLVVRLAGIFISILCCHPVDVEDWSKKAIPLHWQAYLSNCWRALSWQLSIRLSVRCGLMVIGGKTRRRGSIQEGVVTSLLTDRWRVAAMPPFYPSSKDCMESHPCSSSSACLLATAYLLHIEDLDDRSSSRFYSVPPPLLLAWNGRRKESLTRRRRRLEWASFLGWMLQQGRTTNCFRPINLSNCEDSTRQPVHISNNYTRQLEATLGIDTSKHWRLCLPMNDGRQALLQSLSSRPGECLFVHNMKKIPFLNMVKF